MIEDVERDNPTVSRPSRPGESGLAGSATVREAIGRTVGAASMCWEDVGKAGVFDSTRAGEVAEQLIAWLESMGLPGSTLAVDRIETHAVEDARWNTPLARMLAKDQEAYARIRVAHPSTMRCPVPEGRAPIGGTWTCRRPDGCGQSYKGRDGQWVPV